MVKQTFRSPDRIIRLIIGVSVIIGGVVTGSWWGVLGLVPLITAFVGCPVCSVLGSGTCKVTPK
jgi:hypothetical protein